MARHLTRKKKAEIMQELALEIAEENNSKRNTIIVLSIFVIAAVLAAAMLAFNLIA